MAIKLAQLNGWVSLGRSKSDLVHACVELGIDPKGTEDELLTRLTVHLSQEIVSHGPNAEAHVSAEFANHVQAMFAPRQQPQRAAASTPAAQAATSHTAGADPQGNARPIHQNAIQRFIRPQPKPGQEGMSGRQLFWKNR